MEISSTEDVKQLIRREMRLQNLDSFLLFISSASGFFFSLIYVFFGSIEIAVGFIPIIIFGTVIPVYVGYIRGAILLDNLEERVRGWIYLITGLTTYIAFTLLYSTYKLIGEIPSPFTNVLTRLWLFMGGFLLGFFLAKAKLGDRFFKHIFKIFNQESTILINRMCLETEDSAFYVAMCIYLPLIFFLLGPFNVVNWVVFFLFNLFAVLVLITSEKRIRNFIVLNEHSKFVEVERQLIRSSKPRLKVIGITGAIAGATLAGLESTLETILPTSASRMIAMSIVLVSLVILNFSKEEHKITAEFKKDVSIPEDVKKEIELVFERMKEIKNQQ